MQGNNNNKIYTKYSLGHKHNKNYYRNRFINLMIFCRYFYSFLYFVEWYSTNFLCLLNFCAKKRRQVVTDTRRRYTVKNGAIISNRKVEKKNNVIKQQKYVPVCMCVCVCDWGELKNDRVKKSKFTMGGGSELSHRKRERRKRCRRPWEGESETVKERALL